MKNFIKKNKSVLLIYIVFTLLFISLASAQNIIYISNNCEGISPCYSNLPQAISSASDNDKIIVKSGEYFVDPLIIKKDIIIQGEEKENTIIYPSTETTCCSGDSQAWFLIRDSVLFNIHGLTFDGKGKRISQAIRSFGKGEISGNIFKNIAWSDNQGAAIVAFGGDTIIDSNYFSSIGRNAIWVGSYYTKEDFGVNIPASGDNYQITNNVLEGKGECDCIDKGIEIGVKTSGTRISGNELFNYLGRYSAEQSYSMGIFAWNIFGETLGVDISNNSIHNCILPIFIRNRGEANNRIKISGNNMKNNEYDGLNTNYNQDSIINFKGIGSGSKGSEGSNFSSTPDYLFDIKLEISNKNLKNQDSLNAVLRFESFGTKPTPTHINYIILDSYKQEVYGESEDIVVETEKIVSKKFENLSLSGGGYTLHVRVDYGNVSDNFEQDFSISDVGGRVDNSLGISSPGSNLYLFFILGVLLVGGLLVIYLKYRSNSEEIGDEDEKYIKKLKRGLREKI